MLLEENRRLQSKVQELESRMKKDSGNSHKPPSSDGPAKKKVVKSNREKSGRKPGAQDGHEGRFLKQVASPDTVVTHEFPASHRCGCGACLSGVPLSGTEKRQVFDLPEKARLLVTEHRVRTKTCPSCGQQWVAGGCPYPSPAQYGPRVRALAVYLNTEQFIPFDRVQAIFRDLYGAEISDGVLSASLGQCSRNVLPTVSAIRSGITSGAVQHNDETGLRVAGKNHWVHVACTEKLTYYFAHANRGRKAIDERGTLAGYKGTSVHDRYASYNGYGDCRHGLCNDHLGRELKYVHEELGGAWAGELRSLMLGAYRLTQVGKVGKAAQKKIVKQYDGILKAAIAAEPLSADGKRGTAKKLMDAFVARKESILLFLKDPVVPYGNNQAERDLRMIKLKQKISGGFRTEHAAEAFCNIRSYISTVKKQGGNAFDALLAAIVGTPVHPVLT